MKKLSFLLMAMLFSVMSFAAEVTETVTMKGFAGLSTSAYENVTKTGASDKGTAMVAYAFNPSNGQVRGNKTAIAGASVTSRDDKKNWSLYNVDAMAGAIKSIKITCAASNSNYFNNNMYVALGTSSQGAVTTISGAQKNTTASKAEFTFDIDVTKGYTYFKLLTTEKFTTGSVTGVVVTITYEAADNYVAVPSITGETYFKENTTVTLTASEGQKVYYTLDGTEPTNASTEYTAPFELTETTTVKAIAYQGENASEVAEQVFKKMQVLTCAEAAAITPNGDKYIVRGYVTSASEYNTQFNNIDFFVADTKDGGEVLKAYRAIPVTEEDKAVKVGDYVEIIGVLSEYNGTVQVAQGGTYTIIPEPAPEPVKFNVTVTAENGTVEGAGEYIENAEVTLTATAAEGYEFVNWTSGETEVSTANPFTFTVTSDTTLVANFAVVEPEVIAYELNGGELPTATVPTQEELWASFKTATGLDTKALSELSSPVLNTIAGLLKGTTWYEGFDVLEWKWLKSYIQTIQANQAGQQFVDANGTTRTVVELKDDISSDDHWRFAVAAFFAQSQYVGWPTATADFTEAGKPEAWGAAYQAAHAVVLPTEPVDAPYTLPTPVKEGYTFVGWYDNAEGTGEAYTVIPAGWSGTLYAIWKQSPTTALDNIAIEGKVVKTIINGQLIIINNGVQYNALGQVIR